MTAYKILEVDKPCVLLHYIGIIILLVIIVNLLVYV